MVVLAVDVIRNGTPDGDVLGARGDGQKEAEGHGEVEDLRKGGAGLAAQDAGDRVKVQQAVHAAGT